MTYLEKVDFLKKMYKYFNKRKYLPNWLKIHRGMCSYIASHMGQGELSFKEAEQIYHVLKKSAMEDPDSYIRYEKSMWFFDPYDYTSRARCIKRALMML